MFNFPNEEWLNKQWWWQSIFYLRPCESLVETQWVFGFWLYALMMSFGHHVPIGQRSQNYRGKEAAETTLLLQVWPHLVMEPHLTSQTYRVSCLKGDSGCTLVDPHHLFSTLPDPFLLLKLTFLGLPHLPPINIPWRQAEQLLQLCR